MEKQKSGSTAINWGVTTRNKRRREEDEATAAENSITGKKRFCCSKCDMATDKLSNFNKHLQSHGSKQEFTCPHCDFSSSRRHGVLLHLKHSHNSSQALSSEKLLKQEEDANMTCPPAENILKPAVDINESTKGVPEVVELIDDDEESVMPKKPKEFVFEHVQKPDEPAHQEQKNDEQPGIAEQMEVFEDDNQLNQLSLEMAEKEKQTRKSEVKKLRAEIKEKLRALEAHKALYYRERVKELTSRKVELILLATKLEKGSVEYVKVKREMKKVEADFKAAVINQSSFSSILEELDSAPERVCLLQPDEVQELQDSFRALLLKLKEANERLAQILEIKKVLEAEKWTEQFAKLVD